MRHTLWDFPREGPQCAQMIPKARSLMIFGVQSPWNYQLDRLWKKKTSCSSHRNCSGLILDFRETKLLPPKVLGCYGYCWWFRNPALVDSLSSRCLQEFYTSEVVGLGISEPSTVIVHAWHGEVDISQHVKKGHPIFVQFADPFMALIFQGSKINDRIQQKHILCSYAFQKQKHISWNWMKLGSWWSILFPWNETSISKHLTNPSVFLLSFPNVLIHFIRNTRLAAASTGQPGIGKRWVFPAQNGLSESSIVRFSTGLGGGHPKQEQQRSLLFESALYQCRIFL